MTDTSLLEQLRAERDQWMRILPAAALTHTFVLRNGRAFTGRSLPAPFKRGPRKQCFANSTKIALDHGLTYVEGFARCPGLPFAFAHAWVIDEQDGVIDSTLDDTERVEYVGVPFDCVTLWEETLASGVYGLLDKGWGANVPLMFRRDPQLAALFPDIHKSLARLCTERATL